MAEEVKAFLKEEYENIKEGFIPSMTNILMDVFHHGIIKGSEIRVKIDAEASRQKNQSAIKWQTGEPKENGEYLVSLEDGSVCRDEWRELYCEDCVKCWVYNEGEVTAWCKLSDIEPYKEETK